ncbi:hypothetical protein ABCS02_22315 [Microbacterium sp. X-17]|uniref:hypothetical protein n=1 Tax=Microbacterium sp. X-17 TaxID=3144404 RepID=UPI0031F58EDF
MRALTIAGFIGAGAILLTTWMLVVSRQLTQLGDADRGLNVVLFLGGTILLLAGIVLAVILTRSPRRDER